MASGNGTKIHRRQQSGEDLLTPLLAVRSFLEEPGLWGCGQLNTRQAKVLSIFSLLPRTPPQSFSHLSRSHWKLQGSPSPSL